MKITKGSFGFDVMGLMLLEYVGEEWREPIVRQYANVGSSYIRFMIYYVGRQDWKSKNWVAPWPRKNGKVNFKKIDPKWKEELEKILRLLIKYNQVPIISLFDGCHWTEHESPFASHRNVNGVSQIYNLKDLWLYKKVVDATMKVIKKVKLKEFVIEIGNEPWFSNTPVAIAEFHREIIKYLYTKYKLKPSQIMVNATEKFGKPPIAEWLQAKLLCDKTQHVECGEFEKKNTGPGGIIFSYHGIGFPHHLEEGGPGHRPFSNRYVSTEFQTNNNWSNDGQTVDPNDPENKKRPCSGEPLFKNRYCSPNKEELAKFYDHLLTKCKKSGMHFYTYSDLSKEVQKAKKENGAIVYWSDWSLLDIDRVSVLPKIYKKHFRKYPENYGKFPGFECKDGDEEHFLCPPDGPSIVVKKCVDGKWVNTGEKCPDAQCSEGDTVKKKCPGGGEIVVKKCVGGKWINTGKSCNENCSCFNWLLETKVLTWALCLLGLRDKKCN